MLGMTMRKNSACVCWTPEPAQYFGSVSLHPRSQIGEEKHGEENRKQSQRCDPDILHVFGQDRGAPIHEFKMNPIDQQGSLAQLNERTEAPLSGAALSDRPVSDDRVSDDPAAPSI